MISLIKVLLKLPLPFPFPIPITVQALPYAAGMVSLGLSAVVTDPNTKNWLFTTGTTLIALGTNTKKPDKTVIITPEGLRLVASTESLKVLQAETPEAKPDIQVDDSTKH